MTAERLAAALHARRVGAGWIACCPAHEDRRPSLSIHAAADGTVLVRCHAGCNQSRVIATLRSRGLWSDRGRDGHCAEGRSPCGGGEHQRRDVDDILRTDRALSIWAAAKPARGTPVETYLRSRGLSLPILDTLRFHTGLKHPSGRIFPAMVALVTSGVWDVPIAIHRTFLASNGANKVQVAPQRMMLGPCRGGVVRLAVAGQLLMVGEGIESCLASMRATTHAAWAALSTSGMRSLDLPDLARDVIVLADGDDAGEAAAQDCARRWKREGRRVRIARPPRGMDFNDMLVGRVDHIHEDAT